MNHSQIIFNVNEQSISQSDAGAVLGLISIQIHEHIFPESNWNDFIVVVLNWWTKEIVSLCLENQDKAVCEFMDGPFYFVLKKSNNSGRLECSLCNDGNSKCLNGFEIEQLQLVDALKKL